MSQGGLESRCCTGGGTLSLDRGGSPHNTHPVVSVCVSVDWPHTLLCTCEGRSGRCILFALCGIHNLSENIGASAHVHTVGTRLSFPPPHN